MADYTYEYELDEDGGLFADIDPSEEEALQGFIDGIEDPEEAFQAFMSWRDQAASHLADGEDDEPESDAAAWLEARPHLLADMATFSDGSKRDVTTQATWSPTAAVTPMPSATVSSTGLVTGRTVGNTSVRATFRGLSGSLPIQVDTLRTASPILVSCSAYGDTSADLSPQLACLPSGVNFSVHCKALGTFTSAGTQEITDQVAWVTNNPAVARPTGLVAFNAPVRQSFRIVGNGQAILRATLGAKTSSTTGTLRINPWVVQGVTSTVTGVQVTPPSGNVEVGGDPLALVATATLTGTGTGAARHRRRETSPRSSAGKAARRTWPTSASSAGSPVSPRAAPSPSLRPILE